jgi:hypothetical protein
VQPKHLRIAPPPLNRAKNAYFANTTAFHKALPRGDTKTQL